MLTDMLTPEQSLAVIRAQIDDRFGQGTCEALLEVSRGEVTQTELAARLGMTQPAVSQRIRAAMTYLRRIEAAVRTPAEVSA